MQHTNDEGKRMEWLNENAKGLGFIFTLCAAFVGWLVTLERRLSGTVSRVDMEKAFERLYNKLDGMSDNLNQLIGKDKARE